MPGSLFADSAKAFKAALAREMGCEPHDYESHALTVCARPEASREPHLALATTCGTGTVLSVRDRRLAAWAKAAELPAHHRVFLPSFLEGLAAHARELGHEGAKSHSASTGMVLAELPSPAVLPAGHRLVELSWAQHDVLRATKQFDNALLDPDERSKLARFRTAFAIFGAGESPLAVAGVWDQYTGFDEIGVDVAREARGHGLGHAVTVHATRWIVTQGRRPIYTFGFTNIRSANNGLSAGFRPLWQLAAVYRPQDME